jgi:hypothetical protein
MAERLPQPRQPADVALRAMRRAATIVAVLTGVAQAARAAPATSTGAAATASASLSTVAEIDKRCDLAERVSQAKPDRVFADVSDDASSGKGQEKWREFRDPAGLKRAAATGPLDTQVFVWRYPDGVLFVEMVFQSDSGDWMRFASHCFRADRTLARVTSTLNSFTGSEGEGGGLSQVQVKHFSSDGTVLKKQSRLLDLETRKPAQRSLPPDSDEIVYRRFADVPFFALFEKQTAAAPPAPAKAR